MKQRDLLGRQMTVGSRGELHMRSDLIPVLDEEINRMMIHNLKIPLRQTESGISWSLIIATTVAIRRLCLASPTLY